MQSPKMFTSRLSVMDENPSSEFFHRNLAVFATAAGALHVLWRYDSHSDSFAGWLGSVMPTILTGFILVGFLMYATSDPQYFPLTTVYPESGNEKKFRSSSDPAREDRHFFYVQVIAFVWSLSSSIDLVCVWYRACHALWDENATEQPTFLLIMVTLCTAMLGLYLLLTWLPFLSLEAGPPFDDESSTKGSENGDTESRAKLRTLVAATEAYEKDLLFKKERPQSKMDVTGKFLSVLREWQASDQ